MTSYTRYRIPGGCYFFTVTLADRHSSLLTTNIPLLRKAFRQILKAHPFTIDAIVILPEHLHCVWTLPENDDNFSMRWRQIKSTFSRQLPKTEHRSRSRIRKNELGIWQRRFWEHAIRDERDFRQHVDYIHYNPVKHGYVERVSDWRYSSFRRFVARGMYAEDWSGGDIGVLNAGEVE